MRKEKYNKTVSFWGKLFRFGVAFEIVSFVAAYGIYYRLNRRIDYRYHCHKNYPFILEIYYQIGEKLGSLDTRQTDQKYWKLAGKQVKK